MNIIIETLISIVFMFLTEVFGKEVPERGAWVFPNDKEEEFLEDNKKLFRDLEQLRLKHYSSYRFRKRLAPTIFFVLILLPPLAYLYFLYGRIYAPEFVEDVFLTTLAFSAFMVVFLMPWMTSPKRQYMKQYKAIFLPQMVKLYGDFSYRSNERYGGGGFLGSLYDYFFRKLDDNPRKVSLLESKIVPGHRDYHADDLFEGVYQGVKLSFADVTLRSYAKNRENRATTVFQGLIIELNLGKTAFNGHTAVLDNKISFLDTTHQQLKGLKRVKFPAPEFERAFDAYGTDQVEARFLLDPAMMERLLAIYKEFSGQGMAVAFYKNKVTILISTSYNPFESDGLYAPAGCHHSILRVKKEFEYVLSLIDRLKLYDPQRGS